jgi:hypothetical protein
MRPFVAVALIMSLAAALAAQAGDVYRSIDAQGNVKYSDTPSPGAELIHVQDLSGTGGAPSAAAGARSAASSTQALARSDARIQAELQKQNEMRAVQKDVEADRAGECKKRTEEYDQMIHARRIYKTGADGERDYLSDAEADQMRLNLRQAKEAACGSS